MLVNRKILIRIEELKSEIKKLPPGYISHKKIYGKEKCYYQWRDNGVLKSKYIKKGELEGYMSDIEKRREYQKELRQLQKLVPESIEETMQYSTNVITGDELKETAQLSAGYEKRDCYRKLEKYLYGNPVDKVCVLYGLRRTGKTTLIRQLILNMTDENMKKAAYIKIHPTDTMAELNFDIKKLKHQGYKYIFIDEITLMSDFIDTAAILSDIYAAMGMKIILSGTDSLGFRLAENQELYDRAYNVHTTFIPFREYSRLLKKDDIDEDIRYGGTLLAGEIDFDDDDLYSEDSSFRDDESTRRYVDTAISKNIQHSLTCCENGRQFRHLITLYEKNELTNAINRIIEDMNHRFLVDVVTREFKSADLRNAANNLRHERNPEKRTEILDIIDEKTVIKRMMDILDMKNKEEQKIGVTKDHITEIKKYLKELDLISECEVIQADINVSPLEYTLFTQPGMRYCQAQALVHSLVKDQIFGLLEDDEQKIVCDKILEDVRGRMLEDIVLFETSKAINNKRYKIFKLRFDAGEFDMVIYDREENVCGIYEIKHSDKVNENQYRHLINEEKCKLTERRFGRIMRKIVLYRGENFETEDGIVYHNVEKYLNDIANEFTLEPIMDNVSMKTNMQML